MDVTPVLEFLRKKIGLNPESIGVPLIEKTVHDLMKISGAQSVEDYVQKIKLSEAELNRLIETVVVPETSFFRNTTPFVTLRNYLTQFVLSKKSGKPVRILCLPCSTGEEVYSIAMTLLDMQLSPNQIFLFAGDISEQVLQIAETGIYNSYSFRGEDVSFKKKYFDKQADGAYLLKKEVRNLVNFERINILSDNFLSGHQPYDVIFCRNLLIYFDLAGKEKALKALLGRLSEEGVLFVGHAEGARMAQVGLFNLDYPMSFVFSRKAYAERINNALNGNLPKNIYVPAQKKLIPKTGYLTHVPGAKVAGVNHSGVNHTGATFPGAAPRLAEFTRDAPTTVAVARKIEPEVISSQQQIERDILQAKRLAEAGSFNEVLTICEQLLSKGLESAEVYYLLGQTAGSSGDRLLAEEYMKKAIYLNADSYDALIYLSTLFSQMGQHDQSANFRRRAQRVKIRKAGAEQ